MDVSKNPANRHRSIMVKEITEFLEISRGGIYADLTFGEGGHAEALLRAGAERVIGLDRDKETLDRYRENGSFRDDPRLTLIHGRLSDVGAFIEKNSVYGAVVDLGVSTRQLLEPERGFSFNTLGPLDMRMDRSEKKDLFERLASMRPEELVPYLEAADVHPARKIAANLLAAVGRGEIQTTLDLAGLRGAGTKRHPATQLFLALRMMVNEEMYEVAHGLPELLEVLCVGGRMAVLTFHSTEDRVVKKTFKGLSGLCVCEEIICRCAKIKKLRLLNKKPMEPSSDEVRQNRRARSAKLRCVEKIDGNK
jgi:16S rRNA (cytosine1402-N4)-methyltransferase